MRLTNQFVPLSTAILFAACSTDAVVSPMKAPTGANLSVSTGTAAGNYVVSMKGNSIPADFASRVASLGGSVLYANGKAGFAAVTGLTADGAAKLGALTSVAEIQADEAVALDLPQSIQADAAALQDPSADSQTNPASAILTSWSWNMRLIGADKAWAAGKLGSSDVTVAILDTGLDYDNRDLTGLVDLSRSTSFMSTFVPATDTSTVRPADDTVTKKVFPTRNAIQDYNGHGTNVGAVVSSKAFAFPGVTSRTTLIGVKVLGSNGSGSFGQILSGILWAADHGADVANMSLGGGFSKAGNGRFVGLINKVFNYAKAQGMLIVVSAGNSGNDLQHNGNFNADYCDAPHVLCVSAVGPTTWTGNPDEPAFYTNYGRSVVDIAAPGGNAAFDEKGNPIPSDGWPWGSGPKLTDIASWVWSFCSRFSIGSWNAQNLPASLPCSSGGRLNGYIGTSQASPHVTGLAALLVAQYGHGQPQKIKHIITQTADPINPLLGRGRVSVKNALGL